MESIQCSLKGTNSGSEAEAALTPFGPIEGHTGFFQIFSQSESQKNQSVFLRSPVHVVPPLIPNDERFKPAFAERDKKQTMIDLGEISTNWFKTSPSTRLSRLGL